MWTDAPATCDVAQDRFLLLQRGARGHYLVGETLATQGMLAAMVTEYYHRGSSAFCRAADLVLGQTSERLVRMQGRYSHAIPNESVRSYNLFGLAVLTAGRLVPHQYKRIWNIAQNTLFGRMVAATCDHTSFDSVYGLNSESLEVFQWAKQHGKRCVLQQVSYPKEREQRLLAEEHVLWPGWERSASERFVQPYARRERQEWALADRIICMSDFVAQGLVAEGVNEDKIAVVPYGLDAAKWSVPDRTRTNSLRVLFAGGVRLHKGIQYLYEAAGMLDRSQYEFTAVGPVQLSPAARRTVSQRIHLLGSIPPSSMPEVYRQADVLVLPSISEGYGWVTHEAMASGIPVITTENARGIVRDGLDGFVVPIRDPESIADRLTYLRHDADLYAGMAQNALERATGDGSVRSYAARLVDALDRGRVT